ncbi:MAG: hypothetical protein CME32_27185 [Gimesia sp.]|nr:hypothetical protein [Gimesia sp.]
MTFKKVSGGPAERPQIGSFHLLTRDPDLQAIMWALNNLQQKAAASTEILFDYGSIINKITELT